MRCKNRVKYAPKKTIIQDNIYVIRQFAYIYEVAEILLFKRKITRYGRSSIVFSLKNYKKS